MSGQYNNFVERLKTIQMKVETTEEEFLREKHFSFTCGEGRIH